MVARHGVLLLAAFASGVKSEDVEVPDVGDDADVGKGSWPPPPQPAHFGESDGEGTLVDEFGNEAGPPSSEECKGYFCPGPTIFTGPLHVFPQLHLAIKNTMQVFWWCREEPSLEGFEDREDDSYLRRCKEVLQPVADHLFVFTQDLLTATLLENEDDNKCIDTYAEVAEISAVIGETLANETNIHEGLAGMGLDTMLRQEMLSIFILWDHNTTWDEIGRSGEATKSLRPEMCFPNNHVGWGKITSSLPLMLGFLRRLHWILTLAELGGWGDIPMPGSISLHDPANQEDRSKLLIEILEDYPNATIAEVGSYKGELTAQLAERFSDITIMSFEISDHFFRIAQEATAKYTENVIMWHRRAEEAAWMFKDGTFDMVLLDNGAMPGYLDSFRLWIPKVKSGGILAYCSYGFSLRSSVVVHEFMPPGAHLHIGGWWLSWWRVP